jgi:hypothetical protein
MNGRKQEKRSSEERKILIHCVTDTHMRKIFTTSTALDRPLTYDYYSVGQETQ